MLYSILIYGSEDQVGAWSPEHLEQVLDRHAELRRELGARGQLGPVMRLTPNDARTIRRYKDRNYITDGPFAETKEQLMGLYVVDCATVDDALATIEHLTFESAVFEVRAISSIYPGVLPGNLPPK